MKVLVVSGSSGGHIFPALSLLDALRLKDKNAQVILVLPRVNIPCDLSSVDYPVYKVSITNLRRGSFLASLISILNFCKGFLESAFILLKFRPEAVVGFGSLVAIPVIFWAWILRIPILLHEQNVFPGRANRLLAVIADRIAVSFLETYRYLKVPEKKIVLTGNPLRRELIRIEKPKALDFFGLKKDRFTILIMGGSQGSRRLNSLFIQALQGFREQEKDDIQVIHLCGQGDYELISPAYKALSIEGRVFAFFESMQYAYSASDLIVSRSGASSIAEIMFYRIPAILIPYPYAYAHQVRNAAVLGEAGCAVIKEEKELTPEAFRSCLEGLLLNPGLLESMRFGYQGFKDMDADIRLADAVLAIKRNRYL
ncbi:MAG: undecaprenyldiphospho-muramoylpentapeptide beta-N-acetylglucosaminyltransferase [Candidatus Omnitrophota bacterium]